MQGIIIDLLIKAILIGDFIRYNPEPLIIIAVSAALCGIIVGIVDPYRKSREAK